MLHFSLAQADEKFTHVPQRKGSGSNLQFSIHDKCYVKQNQCFIIAQPVLPT